MARQVEESLPATERTDELPVLSSDVLRTIERGAPVVRPDTGDALDRSLEALRLTLEHAETRWRQLETRIEEQDRAIRDLKDELRLARLDRLGPADLGNAGVPELTEIVRPAGDTGS